MSVRTQVEQKLTRRSVVSGAAALGGGAALATAFAPLASAAHGAPAVRSSHQKLRAITASSAQNIVATESGKLYGYSRDGVIGYRGIPYGATAADAGRFMPAQQVAPWTGVRSALYWGWSSPTTQNCTIAGRRASWAHDDEAFMFEWDDGQPSEDCLRLNVWTPALDNRKRAVMFWIHGGGMTTGSSNELRAYDGENLARQQDVVVVSINHRLGVLGFLNLMEYGEQYADSPNVSMLDIIAALKWVKTNIDRFGGNPDCVMIFGQSGGGGKVGTIMGMPGAKGLFHRASIQSGSGLHQVTMEGSVKVAHATLAELGVSRGNIRKLHTDFTYQQIVEAGMRGQQKASAGDPPLMPGERGAGWGPTVDGRLIPRHTWDPAAPDASADVPLLVGNVLNEQGNSVQMGDAALEDIDLGEAQRRLPAIMGQHRESVLKAAQKLYPRAKPFELYSRCSGMINQMLAYKQAQLKSQQGKAPAYLYRFEWQSPMCDGRARAYHTSELPFCFDNVALCANLTGDTPEAHELAARVAGAWAAFAKTGNPNHAGIPKWEAFNDSVPTMRFDNQCKASKDPDAELRRAEMEAVGL